MDKPIVLEDEKAILLNHNYDGIHELDNPLPKWWLIIFYSTMIFAVFYYGYYEFGGGPSLKQELESDLAAIQAMAPPPGTGPSAALNFDGADKDPALLASGKAVFVGKCAACHGDNGQGLVGPNLTDHFWIHGAGTMADIAKVVQEGVAEKGMPPWGPVLSQDELKSVTVFVASLIGTNPANPKAPQGNEIK